MPNQLEQAAANVMGAAKAIKGTLHGLSGVFTTLMEEHGKVSALLIRVKMSSDPEVRRELFPTIRKELLAHEKAEMTVLYPVYAQHPETATIAREHDSESPHLEAALARLQQLDAADPAWAHAFEQLVKVVEHHVKEEEISWFPAGNRVFGAQAEALDAHYQRTKSALLVSLV